MTYPRLSIGREEQSVDGNANNGTVGNASGDGDVDSKSHVPVNGIPRSASCCSVQRASCPTYDDDDSTTSAAN